MPSPHHRRPCSPGAAGEHALLSHEDDAAWAEAVVRRVGRPRTSGTPLGAAPPRDRPGIRFAGGGDLDAREVTS
ncbi:hypothetical protein OHA84_04140 [Streptomyces sp. NBC_00513]|uniref:hypothetical protein n=1 Tax=unclassified Streptomyces TaxID=2593676 RepID=UPI002256EEB1|nr:hypothetical protein [Streptomyces sp. NBC_00424]MCX5077266.1 hypothetical protein [Streptomyces sp. NBC_00424]WUD39747.1 hypothetical protein OHA84_04140 [Streptomyces sp. NBC_00513]